MPILEGAEYDSQGFKLVPTISLGALVTLVMIQNIADRNQKMGVFFCPQVQIANYAYIHRFRIMSLSEVRPSRLFEKLYLSIFPCYT